MDTALELNVNPARASSAWLDSQVEGLTKNVQKARADLSDYQQRSGIVGAGTGDDDESGRLADLNAQLVAAQSQNHPAIQALKNDLARAQAKLNDLPPQLGPNHPTYKRAQGEVSALQAHLEAESEQLAAGLRREIAAQKATMLQMKREHSKLAELKDVVDNAQRALDDAMQRATQARMNSQVTQTNISVVRVAVPPRQPVVPNPLFNFALATLAGIALAIGLALWREVVCRFIRSTDDLRDFLGVQVLGVLHAGPRASSGRARLTSRQSPMLAVNR
jgi:succinoglycan biosynthesis transport protein ExoP